MYCGTSCGTSFGSWSVDRDQEWRWTDGLAGSAAEQWVQGQQGGAVTSEILEQCQCDGTGYEGDSALDGTASL